MVRAASYEVPRASYYSGTPLNAYSFRRLRDFHPLWSTIPGGSTRTNSAQGARNPGTNPGLGYSDFARRYLRNRCLFLFLQVLRCFSSLRSLLTPMYSKVRYLITMLGNPSRSFGSVWILQAFKVGFPIRISMDQSLFAAPHGFSQRITSFFACACQGIHQMPLRHLIVLIANAHL